MSVEGVSGAYPAVPTSDEKTMSMIAHAGGIFFGFLPALVVYLMKKDESSFVKAEATEALNFQITLMIAYVVASVLVFLLIALDANRDNALVNFVLQGAERVDLGIFSKDNGIKQFTGANAETKNALFNWGLGAVAWLVVGRMLERLIRP